MLLGIFAALAGCRSRAYNDLYVENMAAEIRDLEDQLYEYDYEYRLLEQELATLRAQNAQLEGSVSPQGQSQFRQHHGFEEVPPVEGLSPSSPLEFYSPSGPTLVPDPIDGQGSPDTYVPPGSILEGETVVPEEAGSGLRGTTGDEAGPSDGFGGRTQNDPRSSGMGSDSSELPPPRNGFREPSGQTPGTGRSQQDRIPESPFRQFDRQSDPGSGGSEFDFENLVPPTIEPGEPMPPPLPVRTDNVQNSPGPANALELNLGRIEVPAQLASQRKSKPRQDSSEQPDAFNQIAIGDEANLGTGSVGFSGSADEGVLSLEPSHATISPAQRQVTDTRVVELAFHPTLSRAANFDDVTDDDGLYLVLQPRNAQGQVVPIAADLAIVILDPAREGDAARIGRRDFSANEVRAKMQPRGTNQGVHLRLPWNGPDPSADRVLVFARYTFPDGRQVVGEKTFFVSNESGLKTVWAPRGVTRSIESVSAANRGSAVVAASSTSGASTASHSRVVRPAVGTTISSSAPQPNR